MFSVLGVAYGDHIVAEVGPKMVIFWVLDSSYSY